jgi:hypothetical protein
MSNARVKGYPGITINAKAIAQGVIDMMDENEVAAIRFGLLPKRWVDMLEVQMESVVRSRFNDAKGEAFYGFVGDHFYDHVKIKDVVSQMVKQVCHEMYGCVEMVV